ncbi:MAG: hypothetical protein MRJ68_10950 [Nitrospira sp.]|nr:hypothetical protein [Nitrospira sp.]
MLKEEIRVLRDHIAQLGEGLADHDRLRAQIEKLGATQDRVHQLEVELSDREAAHRGTIQQLERTSRNETGRLKSLYRSTTSFGKKESEIKEWEKKLPARFVNMKGRSRKPEQCTAQDQLHEHQLAEHQLREEQRLAKHQLHERDEQIARLQRQLQDLETVRQNLTTDVQRIPEKDEQITRPSKAAQRNASRARAEASLPQRDRAISRQLRSPKSPPALNQLRVPPQPRLPLDQDQPRAHKTAHDRIPSPNWTSLVLYLKSKLSRSPRLLLGPKPALETKTSPDKTASGATRCFSSLHIQAGTTERHWTRFPRRATPNCATPSTKAEPINKAVFSAKQSPDERLFPPNQP